MKLSLRKLQHLAGQALRNGIRLHFDTLTLFRNKSYPTSLFLSVLALEEIGKAYALDHFAWTNKIHKRNLELEEAWINDLFSDHRGKQLAFMRGAFHLYPEMKKLYKFIESKQLDRLKQNSLYVGLERAAKGKPRTDAKIINPSKFINKQKAKKQIEVVHDFLLHELRGIMSGSIYHDLKVFRRILDKSLFEQLNEIKL